MMNKTLLTCENPETNPISLDFEKYPKGPRMSFCGPSEMNGDRFSRSSRASTSRSTDHSEGHSSHAPAASQPPPPRDSKHHVYVNQDERPWPVDPEAMMTYSTTLYHLISQDEKANQKITNITAIPPVTANALHTIVKAVSRKETGGRLVSKRRNFESTLDLSIALWSLTCSTTLFEGSAKAVKDCEWNQATETQMKQQEGWMFIALVFAWGDVFQVASRKVICDFSSEGELPDYLPEELKVDIRHKRTGLLKETYDFIIHLLIGLVGEHPMSTQVIYTGFKRLNVDLSKPEAPENFSPETLLQSLAAILTDPPQDLVKEAKPQTKRTSTSETLISAVTKNPDPAGARTKGLGRSNVTGHIAAKLWPQKGQSKTTAPPVTNPEENEFLTRWSNSIVPSLNSKIQVFREESFKGLELEQYSELRGKHILTD